MSPDRRIQKMCQLSTSLRRMAIEAIRRYHPEFDEDQIRMKFIEVAYGKDLVDAVRDYLGNRDHL